MHSSCFSNEFFEINFNLIIILVVFHPDKPTQKIKVELTNEIGRVI